MNKYQKLQKLSIGALASLISRGTCNMCIHHTPGERCFEKDINYCKDGIEKWLESEITDNV